MVCISNLQGKKVILRFHKILWFYLDVVGRKTTNTAVLDVFIQLKYWLNENQFWDFKYNGIDSKYPKVRSFRVASKAMTMLKYFDFTAQINFDVNNLQHLRRRSKRRDCLQSVFSLVYIFHSLDMFCKVAF